MRLCPHLCAALNFIAYDIYDNWTVPSDGNLVTLTPMFCLSESQTFYLYPYPTDNGTERDRGQVRVPKSNKVQHISAHPPVPASFDVKVSLKTTICYQNDSWIFATSTCNLENKNCTFWPFCAKNHWPTTRFFAHFIQRSLGRPTIRSVVDRP